MPRVKVKKERKITVSVSESMYRKIQDEAKRLGYGNLAEAVRYIIATYFDMKKEGSSIASS